MVGTATRRDEILRAALECFTSRGFAATTMEDIRRESGASIGSIYHHFGGKESLAAALYLDGLASYQAGLMGVLDGSPRAEAGVKAVVRHHLDWVSANPALARYLLSSREAEVVAATREPLRELNRSFFAAFDRWLAPHLSAGTLRRLPIDVLHSVLLGPSQEFARLWLAGRTSSAIEDVRDELARAAWNALRMKGAPR